MRRSYVKFLLIILLVTGCFLAARFVIDRPSSSNIVVRDLTITPSEAVVGESVLVEFWIDNKAYMGVFTGWTLKIDNEEVRTKEIHAEAYGTTRVYFRITVDTVGTHTVSIHNIDREYLRGTLTVTAPAGE